MILSSGSIKTCRYFRWIQSAKCVFQFFITLTATEALIVSLWLQDWTVQINIYKNTPKSPQAVAELLLIMLWVPSFRKLFLTQEKHAIAKVHSNFTTEWTQCCHCFTITVFKKIQQRNHHTNIKSILKKIILKKKTQIVK